MSELELSSGRAASDEMTAGSMGVTGVIVGVSVMGMGGTGVWLE